MGKCVKCDKVFHPDYMLVIDQSLNAQKCVFCYLDKNSITIENEETGEVDKIISKEDATQSYQKYLDGLSKNPKIREKMFKNNDSGLIL
ncbi:MAG TPA: hypothetical protein VK982_07900 [Bacteroidales bacterium]|nr:hypothetical protein [Bacteroidales bacterium]